MNRLIATLALCAPWALWSACSGSGTGRSGLGGNGSGGAQGGSSMSGLATVSGGETSSGTVAGGSAGSTAVSGGNHFAGSTALGSSSGSTVLAGAGGGAVMGGTSGGVGATGGTGGASSLGGTAMGSTTRASGGSDGTGTAGRTSSSGSGSSSAGSGGSSGAGSGTGGSSSASSSGGAVNSGQGATIRNDVFWTDTSGTPIYSQGGGVLKAGNSYYWYGVKYNGAVTYAASPTKLNSDTEFSAVTIYSSTDLATWKFEGNALTMASIKAKAAMDSTTWIGRVGAAYNTTTKKYVLIGQYLGSPDTTQFFATSDTPNGTFDWDHTQPVITNVTNNNCGDQSIFTDDDGKAYILCSSLSGRSNTYIVPLRPSDFLEAQPATKIFGGSGREGNAMFKTNGRYYVCSSDLHGWNASHSYFISATNILGPYGAEGVIGNTDADFSHVTQTGLFVTVKGSKQETVIFGGDRWSDFAGNGIGYNQWMPLTFNGTTPVMQSLSEWSIDTTTGTWSVGNGNNFVLNPSFEADRVSTTTPAGWTASGGTNASGGHSGRWSWSLSGSLDQKIAGLPNGTYALAVWAKGTAGTLAAKGFGGTDKTLALSAGSSWTKLSLPGIAVSNGTCQVSISSGSGDVDDFTLIKE